MTSWLRLVGVFSVSVCLCGLCVAADDPAKDPEEPPVRLKKKVRPEQPPKPPEKKQEAPSQKTQPASKTGEDKEEPEVDPKELEEKIKELMTRVGKMLAALPSRWPVHGPVNSEFGTRLSPWTKTPEFHAGMDIRAERGMAVQAPAAGVVSHAGLHAEYGLTVIVDHGSEIRSVYGHLSKISVQLGQQFRVGKHNCVCSSDGLAAHLARWLIQIPDLFRRSRQHCSHHPL